MCEHILGEPSTRSSNELRWRGKGSFRLKLDSGLWTDFESGEGGGIISLVMREASLDKSGAVQWLRNEGFLPNAGERAARRSIVERSFVPSEKGPPGKKSSPKKAFQRNGLRWIRRQVAHIQDTPDHPVRAWMRRRNLWRPQLPLPPSLRWVPAAAPVFRGTHSGAGAIAFPLAPVSAWRASFPAIPAPTAVQLVCISADGKQADYENKAGRRVDKPKFGHAAMSVWVIGDITRSAVVVCEGAADALALAARDPDPVVATLSVPRPAIRWQEALSVFEFVTLWPDMDAEDEEGRRPGADAGVALAQARKVAGQLVDVIGVDIGKDAADAAREAPLGEINEDDLRQFAAELQLEGMTDFESLRYASTLLK